MSSIILQNEEEFSKRLDQEFKLFLKNLKLKNEDDFKSELKNCIEYFQKNPDLTDGLIKIQQFLIEIYSITFENKMLIYTPNRYDQCIRVLKDSYQDAIDFFETEDGERVKQVFYYFAYKYKVPKSQLGGYNIDENLKQGTR